jgi:hypothetical protein
VARLDLYPVMVILGILGLAILILGLAILWELRRLVVARVVARRLTTAAIGLLAVLIVISVPVRLTGSLLPPAPGAPIDPSHLLNWHLGGRAVESSDPTVVTIEVEHPACAPPGPGPWIADPIIATTPWSVTITMHMDLPNCHSQQTPHEGSLPLVGGYLSGIIYPVHLGEPLGGRALYDGSSFPPAAR